MGNKFKEKGAQHPTNSDEIYEHIKDREEEYAKDIRFIINDIFEDIDYNKGTSKVEIRNNLERILTTQDVLYAKYVRKCQRRMKKPIPYEKYIETNFVQSHYWFEVVPDEERKTIPLTKDTLEECIKLKLAAIERFKSIPKDKRKDYIEETVRNNIEQRALDFGLTDRGYYRAQYEIQSEVEKAQAKTLKEKLKAFFKRNYNINDRRDVVGNIGLAGVGSLFAGGVIGSVEFLIELIGGSGLTASLLTGISSLLYISLAFIPLTVVGFGISTIVYAVKNALDKKDNVEELKKYAEALKQLAENNPAWNPAYEEACYKLELLGSPLKERSL